MVSAGQPLFREEAVLHRSGYARTAVVLKQTPLVGATLWGAISLLLVAVAALLFMPYKVTEAARGVLEPGNGVQKIVSPVAARVHAVYVVPGQSVHKDQVLVTLSTSIMGVSGRGNLQVRIQNLQSERDLLSQEIVLRAQLKVRKQQQREATTTNLGNSLQLLRQEAETFDAQLTLSDSSLTALQQLLLQSGISQSQFNLQYVAHLELQRQQKVLQQRELQLLGQLDAQASERSRITLDFALENLALKQRLGKLDAQISELVEQEFVSVAASDDGEVAALAVDLGQSVTAHQPLVYINSGDDSLQAVLHVTSKVFGKIVPGQSLLLTYDAFDHGQYGRYRATIVQISRAALDPREHLLPVPAGNEPVFRVIATLEQEFVEGPDVYPLQPGLLLTGEFIGEEFPLIEFILKPLYGLRGKLL